MSWTKPIIDKTNNNDNKIEVLLYPLDWSSFNKKYMEIAKNRIIDGIKADFNSIRKNAILTKNNKDVVLSKSISTFLGECDRQSKEKDYVYSDESAIKNIEKFIKNLETINSEDSKLEIEYFKAYLPVKLTHEILEQAITSLLVELDKSNKNKCIGFVMGSLHKKYGSNLIDNKMVMDILNSKLS